MAKLSDLIPAAAKVMGLPEKTVGLYARMLREAKLISSGGRGPGAADMNAGDCANLLLAIMGSEHVKDAAIAARLCSTLILDNASFIGEAQEGQIANWRPIPPGLRFLNQPGKEFWQALVELFERARDGRLQEAFVTFACPMMRIEVATPVPHAIISISDVVEDDTVNVFFGDFKVDHNAHEKALSYIDCMNERADFRTIHEVSHRTILALGEMLRS